MYLSDRMALDMILGICKYIHAHRDTQARTHTYTGGAGKEGREERMEREVGRWRERREMKENE